MIRSSRSRSATAVTLGAWIAVLGACTPPPPPTADARAAQATLSACRQRADEVYLRQNRASLYTQDRSDSPESGAYQSGITTRGLADRYSWDTQVSDCVRTQGSAEAVGPTPAATPAGTQDRLPALGPALPPPR